jgi:hypothetical protein
MCLLRSGIASNIYREAWPEGEVRTFYKVLYRDGNALRSVFYPQDYTVGENQAYTKMLHLKVPIKPPPKEILPGPLDINEAIHVCTKSTALAFWRKRCEDEYLLRGEKDKVVTIKVTAKREHFIGCDTSQTEFAFSKVSISQEDYDKCV